MVEMFNGLALGHHLKVALKTTKTQHGIFSMSVCDPYRRRSQDVF